MDTFIKNNKEMLTIVDVLLGSLGVYAFINTAILMLNIGFVGTLENILKLLIGVVTLIYFSMRAYHYYHMSNMDREQRRLEIEKIRKQP